jgi:cell division protein FtsQ
LVTFIWLISLSGLAVLMSFVESKKGEQKCTDVKIIIPGTYTFIERHDVEEIIYDSQGQIKGSALNGLNIHKMEKALKSNPFIESAKVYADMNGIITILVNQREPVLRVLNFTNQDFYIDKNGFKIPVSTNFTAKVLAANGYILESFSGKVDTLKTKLAVDLFKTAAFIGKDSLWDDQIEQLYVNQQKEIEMIPRVGDHKIILGNADSLENKFGNLLAFYKKALPKVGWDRYKTINIKYYNQVVGIKPDSADLKRDSIAALEKLKAAKAAPKENEQDNQDLIENITQ